MTPTPFVLGTYDHINHGYENHVLNGMILQVSPSGVLDVLVSWFQGQPGTWRIIPFSKWLITMVNKSPKQDCSPYKRPNWLMNGAY